MSYLDHTVGAYIRRHILLPLYWKYIKRLKVLTYYQELKNHQWNSIKANREIQRRKLYNIIKYASQNIPYYNRIVKEKNIQFSEENIFDDIKKFPILTKDIIRNNFDKLYKFRDNTYFRNTSGGSTGELAVFYQDKHYLEWLIATKILFDEWAGRKIGDPMVKLWVQVEDITQKKNIDIKDFIRENLYGIKTINIVWMTKKEEHEYVKKINSIKPRLILANTNCIDEFIRYTKRNHLFIYSPDAIMTSAGMLFPEIRARIKDTFNTIVFDRYGSREVGDIACNCVKEQGLHLMPDVHFVEVVDNQGEEVKPGEIGEILISVLENYTMPLIRYKICDKGILSSQNCSCGRGLPLLEKVVGRSRSVFINKKGDYIDGGQFIGFFYFRKNIKQFQVIQEAIDFISINLVLIDKNKIKDMDRDLNQINQMIGKVMGKHTKIKYNIVDKIKPSPSGKYHYIFSKIIR